MRNKFIIAALFGCLILSGCNGDEISTSEIQPSVSTTATMMNKNVTTDAAETSTKTETVVSKKNNTGDQSSKHSEQETTSSVKNEKKNVTVTTEATKAPSTIDIVQSTLSDVIAESQDTEYTINNAKDFPDDDLNWSPLVPVE